MKQNDAGLDEARIEKIVEKLLLVIRDNYLAGPTSRDRVYEALNALAFCTAITVQGTDGKEALQWFLKALNQNLE